MILLRSTLFNLLFFAATGAMVIAGLPLLAFRGQHIIRYVRAWARLVLWLLRVVCDMRLRVTGAEHLPQGGAALIAAQHQSTLDTIVWNALLPAPVYVLKAELLRIPLWGSLARHVGSIPVVRSGGAAALKGLVRAARGAVAAGRQIVIFPEGTRTPPGERRRWQPGLAALAAATGLPVIPVATDAGRFWGRRAYLKRPGVVTLAVLPPLPPDLPREELMARAQRSVETAAHGLEGAVDNSVE
ncbi:lysophospholipid acyltransferase family protein [Muricoccus radiodurans]|uniref:lysophospholipid acyltransferase family protein n=1 Tax=Muricoccus radiodurans TaxID=2231721 RepID=UPI003CEB4139